MQPRVCSCQLHELSLPSPDAINKRKAEIASENENKHYTVSNSAQVWHLLLAEQSFERLELLLALALQHLILLAEFAQLSLDAYQ